MKANHTNNNCISTFSIVGFDSVAQEWGVAVQSKFLAVGSIVPWAKSNAGAIATQSFGNPIHGTEGLKLLEAGYSAKAVLDEILRNDSAAESRQIGIVDAHGDAVTYTGSKCAQWAGGMTGNSYAVQGNILHNSEVIQSMSRAFENSVGPLAERLLNALEAGQQEGGDRRGQQASALLVVKDEAGYNGHNDRYIDLRVDHSNKPITTLKDLYHLHQLYFMLTNEADIMVINREIQESITRRLQELNYIKEKNVYLLDTCVRALNCFLHNENLNHRKQDHGKIDVKVYEYLLSYPDVKHYK